VANEKKLKLCVRNHILTPLICNWF